MNFLEGRARRFVFGPDTLFVSLNTIGNCIPIYGYQDLLAGKSGPL
jgi:hypothetical protein